MKVFLSAIPEVDPKLLEGTQKFLSKIGGPIEYQNSGVLDLAPYIHTFKEFEKIEKLDELDFSTAFLLGQRIKFKLEISYEDVLVIFTKKKLGVPIEESKSWFSYFSDNIIVVRDDELEFFPKGKWLYIYSHQVVENLFQLLSGTTIKSVSTFTHFIPKGCLNDLCLHPPQIEFKLRMAHICKNCLNTAYSNEINPSYLRQIKETIEAVRTNLDDFAEKVSIEEFSPIVVNNKGEIFVEGKKLQLQYLRKAIYLLFLKNPDKVISNQQLKDHKEELKSIYLKIKRGRESGPLYKLLGLDSKGQKDIKYVNTDALKNHRYYITKELKSKLGAAKTEFYKINSWRKDIEKTPHFYNQIGIPQELIQMNCDF
jgi:hypothetical protein